MSLFMDVHSIEGGVSVADVAGAHMKDLETQKKYGVSYLRYWVNEEEGKIFCLVEAEDAEAANTVHREAHGLVADEIYTVSEGSCHRRFRSLIIKPNQTARGGPNMLRKLLILGSILALFVLTAAPAFGLSVNTGQGAKEVLKVGPLGESNPAHGPACGADLVGAIECEDANGEGEGVSTDNPGAPGDGPIPSPVNGGDENINFNVGAWNAVFGPGGMSNDNSAICGIGTTAGTFDPENNCDV